MANPPVMGPGGASRRERYFFRTVTVPPTSVTAAQQANVRPGIPVPDDANAGLAVVRVGGKYRQINVEDPTVMVRVQDVSTRPLQAALLSGVASALGDEKDRWTITDLVKGVNQVLRAGSSGIARPGHGTSMRYAIKRSNYDGLASTGYGDSTYIGVRTDFTLAQTLPADPPSAAGTWQLPSLHTPKLAEDNDGNILVIFAAHKTTTTTDDIVVYRMNAGEDIVADAEVGTKNEADPALDEWAATAGNSFQTLVNNTDAAIVDLCPVWWEGQLFIVVACDVSGGQPCLYVIRLASDKLMSLYSGPIYMGGSVSIKSVSVDLCGEGVLIYVDLGTIHSRFLMSSDLRNFKSVSSDTAFAGMGIAKAVYPISGRYEDRTSAVWLWSTTKGVAVNTNGYIYRTTDAGQSWTRINPPSVPSRNPKQRKWALHDVAGTVDGGTIRLIAVGDDGLILVSDDEGLTWKVIQAGVATVAEEFYTADKHASYANGPAVDFYAIAPTQQTKQTFIIVGEGGYVGITNDAGASMSDLQVADGPGRYYDVVASPTDFVAVGTQDVHASTKVAAASRNTRVLWGQYSGTTMGTKTYYWPPSEDDASPIVGICVAEGNGSSESLGVNGRGYMITDEGQVLQMSGSGGTPALLISSIAQLEPRTSGYRGIAVEEGAVPDPLWVIGPAAANAHASMLWVSDDAYAGEKFVGTPFRDVPGTAWIVDASEGDGAIGGARAFWRVTETDAKRAYGCVKQLDTGLIVFACVNLTQGMSEIFLGVPGEGTELPQWELVDAGAFVFTPADPPGDGVRRPWITQTPDGTIIVTFGEKTRVGLNRGKYWTKPNDTILPLPIGDLPVSGGAALTADSIRGCRSVTACNRGELWSAVRSDDGYSCLLFRAWDWHEDGLEFRPIIPGVPQSLGVHGGTIAFQGAPLVGDVWTVSPAYDYGVDNMMVDSPQVGWRSRSAVPAQGIQFVWDRQNADVISLLGNGDSWELTAIALFGTSFPRCVFEYSDPTDDAAFTDVDLTLSISTQSNMIPMTPGGSKKPNVLWKTGNLWVPHQFKPRGSRQYYAICNDGAGQIVQLRILDNTHNALMFENSSTDPNDQLTSNAYAVTIFGNRFLCSFEPGDCGGVAAGSGLRSTKYRFGRYIRVTIPVNTASYPPHYAEIGTVMLCAESLASTDEVGFDQGFTWAPIGNVTEEVSLGGIKSVTHHGRTGQVWQLQYLDKPDARDRRLNAIFNQMRQPFVIQFVNGDSETIELVRLVATQTQHVVRDYNQSDWVLEEVL